MKRPLCTIAAIAAALALLVVSGFAFFQANLFIGLLLLIAGLCFLVCYFIFGEYSRLNILANLLVTLAGGFFLYLLTISGPHGYKALWLFIYPPAVFYLFSRRSALLVTGVFFISALNILLLQEHLFGTFQYDVEFRFIFLCSLFIVGAISFAFATAKSRFQHGLENVQQHLAQEEKKLADAKKMVKSAIGAKSEFLANMSHELRTPLNHITGFTELIVDQKFGELNGIQRKYLNDALQSSKYLLALINDILDLKRAETGKLELEISDIDIKTLVENSMTMIREKSLNHGIALSMKFDSVSDKIRADQRKLQQVLYNLLSNAAKFTPDGGSVTVGAQWVERNFRRASSCGGAEALWVLPNKESTDTAAGLERRKCVEFMVSDNGIGIKAADRERIFNQFEQGDGTPRKKFQGTGLGLSLTRRYVELHGGRIWVESEGESRGSTFRFIIPA